MFYCTFSKVGKRIHILLAKLGAQGYIMSMKVSIKIELQMSVYVRVVYESVKGSASPRVREMDEEVEPQTLIYIC